MPQHGRRNLVDWDEPGSGGIIFRPPMEMTPMRRLVDEASSIGTGKAAAAPKHQVTAAP
jgi:hypothetical protein